RSGDKDSEKTAALVNALKTEEVKTYIEETYNGAVVAIF
ncbi:MAG: metal ABC transporter substrate-binding protein, partial [Oscillospiraceae bacterium]|nr:metal ABC transporter substrate-binding protein [Oscillospiraceae bacterium]